MQCQEIEFLVRKKIGQPDPLNSRFTPGTILEFIKLAVWKVAFDVGDLKGEYDVIPALNADEIVLPEKTITVHWVTYDGRKIQKRDANWLHEHFPSWPNMPMGRPEYYYHRRVQNKLRSIGIFKRIPEANKTVRVCASVIPDTNLLPSSELPIAEAFHPFVIPLTAAACMNDLRDKIQEASFNKEYTDAFAKIGKIAQEADDDGPVGFSPGNPVDSQLTTDIRFWL